MPKLTGENRPATTSTSPEKSFSELVELYSAIVAKFGTELLNPETTPAKEPGQSAKLSPLESLLVGFLVSPSNRDSYKVLRLIAALQNQSQSDANLSTEVYNLNYGVEEADYQGPAPSARLIAVLKSTLLLSGKTAEERQAQVDQMRQNIDQDTDQDTLPKFVGSHAISVANDVVAHVVDADGNWREAVHKQPKENYTKMQMYQAILKWLKDPVTGEFTQSMGYSFGIAGFDLVNQIGVSSERRCKITFRPDAPKVLMALVFGLRSDRLIDGIPVSEHVADIADKVKAAYHKFRKAYREDPDNNQDLSGFNPATGVLRRKMKRVNGGLVIDSPLDELLIEKIEMFDENDRPIKDLDYDQAIQEMRLLVRGDGGETYHRVIRKLLQLDARRRHKLKTDEDFLAHGLTKEMKSVLKQMEAAYLEKHPDSQPILGGQWYMLEGKDQEHDVLQENYVKALQHLHEIQAKNLRKVVRQQNQARKAGINQDQVQVAA